jgi:hypothetical protein
MPDADTETLAEVLAGGVEAANSAFRGARPGSPNDLTRRRIVTALEALAARVEQARAGEGALRERVEALEAAVDRVRRRHPRGDEEAGMLAPGLWCPTCGRERSDNGYGACPDRAALADMAGDQT